MNFCKKLIIISLCIYSGGCDNIEKKPVFVPSTEIRFPIDSMANIKSRFFQYYNNDIGNEYLIAENANENSLEFFNLKNNSFEFEIIFERIGPNGLTISGAYIENLDTIFVNDAQEGCISLTDTSGIIKQRYYVKNLSDDYRLISLVSCINPLYYIKNQLFVNILVTDSGILSPKDNLPIEALIDPFQQFAIVKARYPSTNNKVYGAGLKNYFRIINDDQLIYSFGYSSDLYIVNISSDQVQTVDGKSKFQKDKIEDIKDLNRDNYFSNEFKNILYGWITYDRYRDLYYRFILHPMEMINSDTFNPNDPVEDRPFSIQILSSDFSILNEIPFPAKEFVFNNFFVSPEGLYISINNYSNENLKEDEYAFKLLQISHE